MHLALPAGGKNQKKQMFGQFSFNDPNNLVIGDAQVTSLTISGNTAHFTGTTVQRASRRRRPPQLTFTVDVSDNCEPGTLDTFSIRASNGYSASGNLTSGDIVIHN
jgi:hypothetical protein